MNTEFIQDNFIHESAIDSGEWGIDPIKGSDEWAPRYIWERQGNSLLQNTPSARPLYVDENKCMYKTYSHSRSHRRRASELSEPRWEIDYEEET
jgi:hypothetical protein